MPYAKGEVEYDLMRIKVIGTAGRGREIRFGRPPGPWLEGVLAIFQLSRGCSIVPGPKPDVNTIVRRALHGVPVEYGERGE